MQKKNHQLVLCTKRTFPTVGQCIISNRPICTACSMLDSYDFAQSFHVIIAANGYAVYNSLGYHWATSLLAFLTLAMIPFP